MLILSLFPGIGLLDMAFEETGACVVRGPDKIWGGDIRRFSPPSGVFDGVIGGPPCPSHSVLQHLVRTIGNEPAADLIPEYERCVAEAAPTWFLMENVPGAYAPIVTGYAVHQFLLDNHWVGGEQGRKRLFSFGVRGDRPDDLRAYIDYVALCPQRRAYTVLAARGAAAGQRKNGFTSYSIAEMALLQGVPGDYLDDTPLTAKGKRYVIGSGVPLPMGRAVAGAIMRYLEEAAQHTPQTH